MSATDFETAVSQTITASNQLHDVINGTTSETVTTDSGEIPSLRKSLVDNFYFLDPLPWTNGVSEGVFNQIRAFEGLYYYAPTATTINPVPMGVTPVGDNNWKLSAFNSNVVEVIKQELPEYTDIVYKDDGVKSALDNMFEGNPLSNAIGDICKTGGTTWRKESDTGEINEDNYRAFNAINVMDCGAIADYDYTSNTGTNSTAAILKAFNARDIGDVYVPPGDYLVDPLLLLEKNAANGDPQKQFRIIAYGAKFWSTADGNDNGLQINQSKRLRIEGLQMASVTGANPTWMTSIRGLWFSHFVDCDLGSTAIGVQKSGGFNSHYYLHFDSCIMQPLGFGTGDNVERHVIQVLTFTNCFISGKEQTGPYAIEIYGSRSINTTKFVGCDISYYSTQGLYIDDVADGSIDFDCCYFDTENMFPLDTSNLFINTYGAIQTPKSGNTNSFFLNTGSYVRTSANVGTSFGRREPMSTYNLIKNGSMRARGEAGFVAGFMAVTDILNNEGYFKAYKNFVSQNDNSYVDFTSISAPFDGWYTLTVIAKVTLGKLGTKTTSLEGDSYDTLKIGNEWTVTSLTKKMAKDGEFKQSFFNDSGPGGTLRIDIAYIGFTYGSVGNLGAIEHPDADFFSAKPIEGGFETVALKPRGSTGLPNSTLFEDPNNGLSFKDRNGVIHKLT